MNKPHPIVEYRPTDPWKFYNYAMYHSLGVSDMFDFMRYENAFMVRASDLKNLLSERDPVKVGLRRFSILFCKVSDKGITRPGWTYNRLSTNQELEEVSDPSALFTLYPDFDGKFKPVSPSKMICTAEVTGNLEYILGVMFTNKAIPENEPHADAIAAAFHEPDKEFTVKLRSFSYYEVPWIF
jgi:hypothetical protein